MNSEITVFTSEKFGQVRTVMKDGQPWFVAVDVCRALEINDNRTAVSRLEDDEKSTAVLIRGTSGGNPNTTIINEPGLYSLVLGSRKPEAKAFKRWITHDVIPAIRKYGLYATDTTIDKILGDPDFGIRLLTELKEERIRNARLKEENERQQQMIGEMQPKVSYCDTILASTSLIPTTLIAKDYGYTATRFNTLLNSLGIQYKLCGTWILYQKYAGEGYMQSYTYDLPGGKSSMQSQWTQKGRLFLYDLLKKNGILPLCERNAA